MQSYEFPLRVETFQKHLKETFEIALSDGNTLVLELDNVIDYGATRSREKTFYAFNLILLDREHKNAYLPQGSYLLKHPILGENLWFMGALGPSNDGMLYQIIFNTSYSA